MGKLVVSLGNRSLCEIICCLKKSQESASERERAAAYFGLSELIAACQRQMLIAHLEELVSLVKCGLCDQTSAVRCAAGGTFDSLYDVLKQRAIEEVVPSFLQALEVNQLET